MPHCLEAAASDATLFGGCGHSPHKWVGAVVPATPIWEQLNEFVIHSMRYIVGYESLSDSLLALGLASKMNQEKLHIYQIHMHG